MSKAHRWIGEIDFSRTDTPVIFTYLTKNSQHHEKASIENTKALNKATWAFADIQKSI